MTVAAVVSTKGGPGKTTVGANLGAFCADAGIRILPIDLDNQPSLSSFYALSHEALERIDYHFNEDESITGIPSGLEAMRQITGGFQDADLIVIAARPSMGKTSLTFSVVDAAPQQKPTNTVQIYRHVDGRQTASSTDNPVATAALTLQDSLEAVMARRHHCYQSVHKLYKNKYLYNFS